MILLLGESLRRKQGAALSKNAPLLDCTGHIWARTLRGIREYELYP